MGKFFLKIFFTPFAYVQNDQHLMGIILRYVCWVPTDPPLGTRRLTDRPTYPPPPSPPLQTPKSFRTQLGSRI